MKPLKNPNYEKSKIICKKTSKSPLKIRYKTATILERGLPICGLRPNHVCA
jgi:hypothetical protein